MLTAANDQGEHLAVSLEQYFFEYLGVSKKQHPTADHLQLPAPVFWAALQYLVESKSVGFSLQPEAEDSVTDTRESLKKTLLEYKQKYKDSKDPQVRGTLRKMIDMLQQQVDRFDEPEGAAAKLGSTEAVWRKALREVFHFYCKQQKIARKDQTFENYQSELTSMNIGEWLRFCKDFELNPQHWPRKESSVEFREARDKIAREINTTVGGAHTRP